MAAPLLPSRRVLARPLTEDRVVPVSAWCHLFSEACVYAMDRCSGRPDELNARLDALGYAAGTRLIELCIVRDRISKHYVTLQDALNYIVGTVWPKVFGKQIDKNGFQRSSAAASQFYIMESDPITNLFISRPGSAFTGASYIAGIIRGLLDAMGHPCKVVAEYNPDSPSVYDAVVYIVTATS